MMNPTRMAIRRYGPIVSPAIFGSFEDFLEQNRTLDSARLLKHSDQVVGGISGKNRFTRGPGFSTASGSTLFPFEFRLGLGCRPLGLFQSPHASRDRLIFVLDDFSHQHFVGLVGSDKPLGPAIGVLRTFPRARSRFPALATPLLSGLGLAALGCPSQEVFQVSGHEFALN
jgi:hypothetical protein